MYYYTFSGVDYKRRIIAYEDSIKIHYTPKSFIYILASIKSCIAKENPSTLNKTAPTVFCAEVLLPPINNDHENIRKTTTSHVRWAESQLNQN
ncbi:hypothetical protein C6A45_20345 [Enterobacter hormaechei]|uniref:Uncharacterized protein n=1 Tax=Enterobacter chengduensis TaxID=2494701 RepID=A0AAW3HIN5_9ENTR|nr:hypothetical protein AM404_27310 [Klebsiella pneumoniae]AUU27697.1 hypothetical protein MC62_017845 [Citrobacter freundii]KJX37100.1 hypothetical protein SG71_08340 [Enterobacter chengduensis]OTW35629.1 hypothetical protein CAP57_07345 [Enterobacter kobei]RCA12967.1 hypothetical protein C6A45_20345 [Enterobacter hormaechei]